VIPLKEHPGLFFGLRRRMRQGANRLASLRSAKKAKR
jgi:hypothetical protein